MNTSKEKISREVDFKKDIPNVTSKEIEKDKSTSTSVSDTTEEGSASEIKKLSKRDSKVMKEILFNMVDTSKYLGYNTFGDVQVGYTQDDDMEYGQLIYMEEDTMIEEEEEEDESLTVCEVEIFDREKHIQDYFLQLQRHYFLMKETDQLHRLMAIYFKNKKLDHVIHDVNPFLKQEQLKKYETVLTRYDELRQTEETARLNEEKEIAAMVEVKRQKLDHFKREFADLLSRAKEIGIGLKSYRTGQRISNEIVKRYISLQFDAIKNLSKARVAYIKEKNALSALNEKVRNLENIGPGLTIEDYEHLLMANKSVTDRIRERNYELDNGRRKLEEKYQISRHVQERLAIADEDVKYHNSHVVNLAENVAYLRERIAEHCRQREYIRRKISTLNKKHYLLFHKTLASDMYKTVKKVIKLQAELGSIKESYNINAEKLKALNIKRNVWRVPETPSSDSQISTVLPKIIYKHERVKYKEKNMLLQKECEVPMKKDVRKIPTDSEMFFEISVTNLSNTNVIINSSQAG